MLILIDEIAVGTDPDQGAALAQSVLEALAAQGRDGPRHDPLRSAEDARRHRPRFANASVGFDLAAARADVQAPPRHARQLGRARRRDAGWASLPRRRSRARFLGPRAQGRGPARQRRRSAPAVRAGARGAARRAGGCRGRARRDAHAQASGWRATRSRPSAAHGEALAALQVARREIDEVRRGSCARSEPRAHRRRRAAATRRLVDPGAEIARQEPRRKLRRAPRATVESLVVGAPVIVPKLGRAEVVALPHDDRSRSGSAQMQRAPCRSRTC